MKLRPIRNECDYENALNRIDIIFNAKEGTKEADELEILSILVELYEDQHYKIELPDPIEAIKFRLEQLNMKNKELSNILGHKSRVSEILNYKRKLNLNMVRNLNKELNISSNVLIQEYDLK